MSKQTPKRQSVEITPALLRMYDKQMLNLIKTTFYRRGDKCDMSFSEYVKTLKSLGFKDGNRIVRKDKAKRWTRDNIMLTNDPMHAKLRDVNILYRANKNKKPKQIIIKKKD